jgi:DNA polymerase elongation subunit (family B)
VAFGFFEGLCSVGKAKERARKMMRSKEEIMRYQFLLHRLNMHTGLATHSSGFRVSFLTTPPKTKFSCRELPQQECYVYDLTTQSSHFHVGPGKLVVHNTDSCFIRLGPTFCSGDTEAELIADAEKKGEAMANEITKKLYLEPILLEYEMVLLKMCLIKRKKYFGIKIEPGKAAKHYMKGIECVRRDFCQMVVKTQRQMIALIFDDKIDEAVRYVQNVMKKLYAGEIPLDDLLMTKKLSQPVEDYKTTSPHVELAKRLNGKYQAGERVEYFIRAGREDLNQRAVTREELVNHRLDYDYYALRQLTKPIQRIMDLIVKRNVFKRMAVTAPIRANSGGITSFVKIGAKRKKRKVTPNTASSHNTTVKKKSMQQKILSFFG